MKRIRVLYSVDDHVSTLVCVYVIPSCGRLNLVNDKGQLLLSIDVADLIQITVA